MSTTVDSTTVDIDGQQHAVVDQLRPAGARRAILDEVLGAFAAGGVDCFVVKDPDATGPVVGVRQSERAAVLTALGTLAGPGVYLRERAPVRGEQPVFRLTAERAAGVRPVCRQLDVARLWSVAGGAVTYGFAYGCRVEFWDADPEAPDLVGPPQRTPAVGSATPEFFRPATIDVEGVARPSIELFDRAFVDEVTFPIDVVYTWVDGNDPAWRERMLRARAEQDGLEYHPEAQAANRYQSRDELRYALRSLQMYAPWVRHVYLVTDRQVPSWLAAEHPGLTVVDHRDIFTDPSVLPVFNSNAIISQLHHIDGLSEHYLYLNDDMFFGTDARPSDFFFANGIAKVFPSGVARSFGTPHAGGAPHFTLSKNIRAALERELGRSISHSIRHTGYPQLRSVNDEIEKRFGDLVDATAAHRFRHHDDIALDQFFHYYAQMTGRAVPMRMLYEYVNIAEAPAVVKLRRLLAGRDVTVFCLNDAPVPGVDPVPEPEIAAFLESYFPVRSDFETRDGAAPA
ncbi:stealth family protein [Jatrophihabitans endophyticus]|uniref:stealth family protein n=1 Tax=Jatrophihabitans endophyticus TaxID=1206085 RepID=UPI001A071AFA|nr:stealth family protein [Jatrophihabitans endophyticus]MBE7189936.1 Stealth CR1 domain-containing protein [Jatrophihabitans endophyticus]